MEDDRQEIQVVRCIHNDPISMEQLDRRHTLIRKGAILHATQLNGVPSKLTFLVPKDDSSRWWHLGRDGGVLLRTLHPRFSTAKRSCRHLAPGLSPTPKWA